MTEKINTQSVHAPIDYYAGLILGFLKAKEVPNEVEDAFITIFKLAQETVNKELKND